MGILKDMYSGNKYPFGEFNIRSKEYSEAVDQLAKAENRLLEQYPEIKTLFEEYTAAHIQVSEICTYKAFETGFRAGAKIMMEILNTSE